MVTVSTMSPTPLPFGSWPSPVTTDLVLSSAIHLSETRVSPSSSSPGIAWIEGRPSEKGRNAIVFRSLEGGENEEVLPEGVNARSRVHEYGGGSYAFDTDGGIVYSSIEGPVFRVERREGGKWTEPKQITPGAFFSFFAFRLTSADRTLLSRKRRPTLRRLRPSPFPPRPHPRRPRRPHLRHPLDRRQHARPPLRRFLLSCHHHPCFRHRLLLFRSLVSFRQVRQLGAVDAPGYAVGGERAVGC